MSEENVETGRRVYAGVSTRLEVPRELFDPAYEFDNTELWPDVAEIEVWNRFFHVWTFRDGMIVRLSVHTDRDRALEVAGLAE